MGISSDGQLSYGIPFDEDFVFPWSEYVDGEIYEWWEVENGYTPLYHVFSGGEYAPGFTKDDPRVYEEYDNNNRWRKENPIPIELVMYCSYDYPTYLIAAPEYNYSVSRGYASKIRLPSHEEIAKYRKTIVDFCNKWGIEMPCEPDFYLTSLYG